MRKVIALLLIAVLLLSGCQQTQSKPNVQYVSTQYYSDAAYPQQIVVIRSQAELTDYYESLTAKHDNYPEGLYFKDVNLEEAFARYDDTYFQNNILLIVAWAAGSSGDRFAVTKVEKADDGLTVHIEKTQEGMTCDMAAWHFLIELDKSYDASEVAVVER